MCLSIVIFIDFLPPLFKYRSFKDYSKHVIEERAIKNTDSKFLSNIIPKDEYFTIFILGTLILIISYMLSSSIGRMTAVYGPNIYYVFRENEKDYALLRKYNNTIVAVQYENKKIIPGNIYISDLGKLNLRKLELKLPKEKRDDDSFIRFNQFILDSFQNIKEFFSNSIHSFLINILTVFEPKNKRFR